MTLAHQGSRPGLCPGPAKGGALGTLHLEWLDGRGRIRSFRQARWSDGSSGIRPLPSNHSNGWIAKAVPLLGVHGGKAPWRVQGSALALLPSPRTWRCGTGSACGTLAPQQRQSSVRGPGVEVAGLATDDTKQLNAAAPLIMHVFPGFGVGGAQVRFAAIANHFGSAFRHIVVSLDGTLGCRERLRPELDVTFPVVEAPKRATFANALRYRRLLHAWRPALLVTNNWGAIEWAMANLLPIARHVHIEDGFGPEERDRQLPRRALIRRLVLARSTVVLPSRNSAAHCNDDLAAADRPRALHSERHRPGTLCRATHSGPGHQHATGGWHRRGPARRKEFSAAAASFRRGWPGGTAGDCRRRAGTSRRWRRWRGRSDWRRVCGLPGISTIRHRSMRRSTCSRCRPTRSKCRCR